MVGGLRILIEAADRTEIPHKIERIGLIVLERLVEPTTVRNCQGFRVVAVTLRLQHGIVGTLLVI
jgi:hypothetical protein